MNGWDSERTDLRIEEKYLTVVMHQFPNKKLFRSCLQTIGS